MSSQIKELFKKYGRTAVGVHLGVYATTFAGAPSAAAEMLQLVVQGRHDH